MGTFCKLGSQLRPHVVWFGEPVPMIEQASRLCSQADLFLLVGTSLAVYPAAGLLDFVPEKVVKYIVDPKIPEVNRYKNIVKIERTATAGMDELQQILSAESKTNL